MADWSAPFDASLIGHTDMLVRIPTMDAANYFAQIVGDGILRWRGGESFPEVLHWGHYGSNTEFHITTDGCLTFGDADVIDGWPDYNTTPRFTVYLLADLNTSSVASLF